MIDLARQHPMAAWLILTALLLWLSPPMSRLMDWLEDVKATAGVMALLFRWGPEEIVGHLKRKARRRRRLKRIGKG